MLDAPGHDQEPSLLQPDPPVAFVHCNNFFADEPRTGAYASVAFDLAGRMTPVRTEEGTVAGAGGQEKHWNFSGYEIPA